MTTCESATCSSQADVAVEQVDGPITRACWQHLTRMLLDGHDQVRGFRRLDREPKCFQPSCDELAVAVARNEDDLPLPACGRHFDDLSWVELLGRLLADERGWSRA